MKFKKPLILIAVICGLSGIAYWDDWKTTKELEEKKTENILFSDFQQEDILSIRLENEQGSLFATREDLAWTIMEPINARGNSKEFSALVNTLGQYKYERDLGDKPKQDFGLDQPKIKVQLTMKDQRQLSLELGTNTPVGFAVYFSTSQFPNHVLIGSQHIRASLNKSLLDLRDKTLGIPPLESLLSWTLTNGKGQVITLNQSSEGWALESPGVKLDPMAMENHLERLSGAIIEDFIQEPSNQFQKALSLQHNGTEKIAEMTWSSQDGETKTYTVLKNNDNLYIPLENPKSYLKLKADIESEFTKTLWDFQDKSIVNIDSNKVTRVIIDGKSYGLDGKGNWVETGATATKDHIRLLLVDLEYSQALKFLQEAPTNLAKPKHQIEIYSGDALVALDLWQSSDNPGVVIVKKNGSDIFYEVDKSILENMKEKVSDDKGQG